jgi:hypothetical protein
VGSYLVFLIRATIAFRPGFDQSFNFEPFCVAGLGESKATGICCVVWGETPSDSKIVWMWNEKEQLKDCIYVSHCLQRATYQVIHNNYKRHGGKGEQRDPMGVKNLKLE